MSRPFAHQTAVSSLAARPPVDVPPLLRQVKALVLLSGIIRPTHLSAATDGALLGLPIDGRRTLLDHWHGHACELAAAIDAERLCVRVLVDRESQKPDNPCAAGVVPISIERDVKHLRGTGGVLHDICSGYHDDDYLLVATGVQILTEPLHRLAAAIATHGSDACLIAHADGVSSGLMLIRCDTLRDIPSRGFVDMKEQALPKIAESYRVTVERRDAPTGLPIRSLGDYIRALTFRHVSAAHPEGVVRIDPFDVRLNPTFSIIRESASVDPSARLHDSVVLEGATVGAGAVLVRSLVARGAVVRPGEQVIDRIVTADAR